MERIQNRCHIPNLEHAVFVEYGGLNLVLQLAKPPTSMQFFYLELHFIDKIWRADSIC